MNNLNTELQEVQDSTAATILVVEDDPFLRKSVAKFISQRGYATIEAEDGRDAMVKFKEHSPSLVLTDLRMPVMDGLDLLVEIASESPQTPVIIFSGVGAKPDIIDALRSGAWDYITKPIDDVDFLIDRIERALIQAQMTYGYNDVMEKALKKKTKALENELEKRKKLEKQIFHAKQEWERTVDCLEEAIALIDRDHKLVRVNKAMAGLFGQTPSDVVGKRCFLSTSGWNNKDKAEEDFELLLRRKSISGNFYSQDGQKHYEVNMTPYYDRENNTINGCVYIARDISNR